MNIKTKSSKKIRDIQGVIVSAKLETSDTWTLSIHVEPGDKDYVAGQFISLDAHQFVELRDLIKYFEFKRAKTEPIRAYSLSSAPHEEHVNITIKPEAYNPCEGAFPPLLSPMLASDIFVGKNIVFSGYTGAFIMPDELAKYSNLAIHLAAGSGIAPSFSIIKDELFTQKNLHMKHVLLFVNKTLDEIIFHDQINKLAKKFPDRLKVMHFLTKESAEHEYNQGRPSIVDIKKLIDDKDKTLLFACGPAVNKWQKKLALELGQEPKPRFMEWVQEVVQELQIDKKRFKREVYG